MKMVGQSLEPRLVSPWVFWDAERGRFLASCRAASEGKASLGYYQVCSADGGSLPFKLALHAVREQGSVLLRGQMVGVPWREEEGFRALLGSEAGRSLPLIAARFDRTLRHLYVSPSIQWLEGIAPERFLAKTNEELGMPPRLVSLWTEKLLRTFRRGEPQELDFRILLGGRGTPAALSRIHSRIFPEFDEQGEVRSVISVAAVSPAPRSRLGAAASAPVNSVRAEQGLEPPVPRASSPRAQALTAEERLEWLTRVSRSLVAHQDKRELLLSLEELVLPLLGDCGGVDLHREQGLERLALFPAAAREAPGLWGRPFPFLHRVLLAARPQLLSGPAELVLHAVAQDEEHLRQLRQAGLQSFLAVPLLRREGPLGCLWFASTDPERSLGAAELALAEELALLISPAVEAARLRRVERELRQRETLLARKSEALRRVSMALGHALLPPQVVHAVMSEVKAALSARAAVVYQLDPSGTALQLLHSTGYERTVTQQYEQIPLTLSSPATQAVTEREGVWVESGEQFRQQYPALASRFPERVDGSWVALPMSIEGRVVGVLAMSFDTAQAFTREERSFALALAQLCAQALERARLYHQLQLKLSESRALLEVRDQFLAVAGHELRTPLTALRLSLESLARYLPTDEPSKQSKRIEQLQRQALRLGQLVDDLLDVSRLASGRLPLVLEELELVSLVEDVLARMGPSFEKAGIRVSSQLQGPLFGQWDRMRLDQVVTNLLSNAVKYGAGQPVEVSLFSTPEEAAVRVADHGIGISPEDQERIFQRFERAVPESHYGGLGLGLWISRELISLMGGRIEVQSVKGQGSTFTVHLPREGAHSMEGAEVCAIRERPLR